MSEREVDSFGRAVPSKRPLDYGGRDRRDYRPHPNQRTHSGGGGAPHRSDWKQNQRQYDSRDGRDERGGRGHGNFDRGYNDRGPGSRHRDDRDRRGYCSRSPPRFTTSSSLRPLQPMKSFKNFVSMQRDEVSSEIYQKRYDEYQLQYLQDASNYFFEKNKCEEWFRERYDPLVQQLMEKEVQELSSKESKRILDLVSTKFTDIAPSFRLNVPAEAEESSSRQAVDSSGGAPVDCGAADEPVSSYFAGAYHHFDGHLNNTIRLSGIPATCTKLLLTQAIKVAVASSADEIKGTVERVCLAQPSWCSGGSRYFERHAWVVLSPASDMQAAVKCLHEARIPIPGPVDPSTGNNIGGIEFKMKAEIHTLEDEQPLPSVYSRPDRVAYDVVRAVELGYLLDKERGIPDEHNLQSVLQAAATHIMSSMGGKAAGPCVLSVTDTLDIAIAYLRRVHLFTYYSGKRFRDEAHLLSVSPTVILRSSSWRVRSASTAGTEEVVADIDAGTGGDDGNDEVDGGTTQTVTALSRRGSGDEDNDDEDTDKAEPCITAGKDPAEVEDGEDAADISEAGFYPGKVIQADLSEAYRGPSSPPIYNLDRIIGVFIHDFRQRVERLEMRRLTASACSDEGLLRSAEGEFIGTVDEEDAKAIAQAQEKVMEQVTQENSETQPDGRARCGFSWCAKLFKGKDFLQKHIRNRHPEVAIERLVRVAERYMLRRFNSEELIYRPLPAIEVEASGGVEIKSVRDVFESAESRLTPAPPPQPHFHGHGYGGRGGGRGGRGRGDGRFNRDGRVGFDRRDSGGRRGDMGAPRNERRFSGDGPGGRGGGNIRPERSEVEYQAPKAEDNNARVLHSYRDVDTPVDVKVDLEYGIAVLPPPKKRRLLQKT